MADNDNLNGNQGNDPFGHPVKNTNWWVYIIGGIIAAGLIIWFFINWSYKDREKVPEVVEQEVVQPAGQQTEPTETLPTVTVEGEEGK